MSRWETSDVEQCLAPLQRYARVLTRSVVLADELVQDTLVRAYERASTFRAGAALKPWLLAILHNLYLDQRRRAAAEARAIEQVSERDHLAPDQASAEHALILEEVVARFATLPEGQRAVLHLVAVEELSYRDAADALGVPVGTIMSRLSRARAALREPASTDTSHPLRLIGGTDVP